MNTFRFKQFSLIQSEDVFKLTTDATLLGALISLPVNVNNHPTALEIGVGTGVISLMLAQRFPNLVIEGIDIDSNATKLASENVRKSPFSRNINIIHSDFQRWSSELQYDLIVTNPPYFNNSTVSSKSITAAMARHQLGFDYERLIDKSCSLLKVGGVFSMIFPFRYESHVSDVVVQNDMMLCEKIYIRHHKNAEPKNMIISAMKSSLGSEKDSFPVSTHDFYLRDESGMFSDQYKVALKEFLLAF